MFLKYFFCFSFTHSFIHSKGPEKAIYRVGSPLLNFKLETIMCNNQKLILILK